MTPAHSLPTAAVIGAGIAGAACAQGLRRAGFDVTVFDKSRGLGGRMATRRLRWADADGTECSTDVDHGAQHFVARHPRFQKMLAQAEAAGVVARWQPRVHSRWPSARSRHSFVATPTMPALCKHLMSGVSTHLGAAVQRLHRTTAGWRVTTADGGSLGPFDQVMFAMPPAQAAVLLAGHHDAWADALMKVRMQACWTLMAITADVDWPWDAAEPDRGPFAWVARNERKPGRTAPPGQAAWVAHTTAEWAAEHLEDDAFPVRDVLCSALAALLPRQPLDWHHAAVHRWRYAVPQDASDGRECWWDGALGLGVCGDFLRAGQVEAAWRSGDELADTVAASQDEFDTACASN